MTTLLCVDDGARASDSFTIQIPAADTVKQLQRRISAKDSETALWRVSSIPAASDELIHLNSIRNRILLFPEDTLSMIFTGETRAETVSIVIQRPPVEGKRSTTYFLMVFALLSR
jgi:hypothetical protein